MGPLIKVPGKHYFKNPTTGSFVYLTGSHTWNNFQDSGKTDPPAAFDYEAHLNWLTAYGHNFIRFWVFEQVKGDQKHDDRWMSPAAYQRTGPGTALDGKPKFNLDKFNQKYFDRLRSRTLKAKDKGLYVSIMFFQGWSIDSSYSGDGNPWNGHPFNKNNNVNGINGDFYNGNGTGEEFHSTLNSSVLDYQKAYIRKVIETVNDIDNVLFEICNEDPGGDSFWADKHKHWQVELADYVKSYEAIKPYQHPVGITATRKLGNSFAWNSNADWVSSAKTSTSCDDAYIINPPIPTHGKVDILDTDHIFGIGGGREWVWKAFMRGYNPIYMDHLEDISNNKCGPYDMIDARNSMGYTLRYANRINLGTVSPSISISSTKYCLYDEGNEYLIYSPNNSSFTVDVKEGSYDIEWFDPSDKSTSYGNATYHRSGLITFTKPSHIKGDAVLYLKIKPAASNATTPSTSTSTNSTILRADR